MLYLQHPSDPIVWWSPRLIWDRPDWLGEPHGRDVLDAMVWIPLVTFWQVTADLPLSTGVPDGHGHNYTREFVDGWATVLQPARLDPRQGRAAAGHHRDGRVTAQTPHVGSSHGRRGQEGPDGGRQLRCWPNQSRTLV